MDRFSEPFRRAASRAGGRARRGRNRGQAFSLLRRRTSYSCTIALGHPFGMTGARIMTTLINGLQTDGKRYGLETMCVGGGQGMAMIVERLS